MFKKHGTKIFKWYDNFIISLYFVTMVRHYANKWLLISLYLLFYQADDEMLCTFECPLRNFYD